MQHCWGHAHRCLVHLSAANGAALGGQSPLGCALYNITGAKKLSTKPDLNLTACYDLSYNTEGSYLLTHDSNTDTCVLYTTLAEATEDPKFEIISSASVTLCLLGTDKPTSGAWRLPKARAILRPLTVGLMKQCEASPGRT